MHLVSKVSVVQVSPTELLLLGVDIIVLTPEEEELYGNKLREAGFATKLEGLECLDDIET